MSHMSNCVFNVKKILQKGKETKRKLATGMFLCITGQTVHSTVHVLMNDIKINVCQTSWTVQYLLLFPVVRIVA